MITVADFESFIGVDDSKPDSGKTAILTTLIEDAYDYVENFFGVTINRDDGTLTESKFKSFRSNSLSMGLPISTVISVTRTKQNVSVVYATSGTDNVYEFDSNAVYFDGETDNHNYRFEATDEYQYVIVYTTSISNRIDSLVREIVYFEALKLPSSEKRAFKKSHSNDAMKISTSYLTSAEFYIYIDGKLSKLCPRMVFA